MIKLLQQNIETNKGFLDNLRKQQSSNDIIAGLDNNIRVAQYAIRRRIRSRPLDDDGPCCIVAFDAFRMGSSRFSLSISDDTTERPRRSRATCSCRHLRLSFDRFDAETKCFLSEAQDRPDEETEPLNSELLINADPRSSLAEAYRQLRTSILLSTAGHAPKSLLVTSSLPSEGKTTTATNTAISLAQTGAKVLIIDADMRRPRLHSVFGVSNGEGLSTILSSEMSENEILGVIQQEPSTKLNLLTSGPIPPNPAELIGSQPMAELLVTLQKNFTHVVIDSPPITSFTDGVLIASMVDGVILVVHSGKSSRQIVRRAKQLLNDVGARIFGVVLNNVDLRSQENYYYYQSYYSQSQYRRDEE